MTRRVLLAVPAIAGLCALTWWWTWRAIEDAWRLAIAANRYRVRRDGARLLILRPRGRG